MNHQAEVLSLVRVQRSSSKHLELLVTIENRGKKRQSLVEIFCSQMFRDSPIPFAPGERRTIAILGPRIDPELSMECSLGR